MFAAARQGESAAKLASCRPHNLLPCSHCATELLTGLG